MTRITESQMLRSTIDLLARSRDSVAKYSQEASSGIRVAKPGDDAGSSPAIADLRESVRRLDQHQVRGQSARAVLGLQESIMGQMNDLLVRAKEIATQGANETLGANARASLAAEVFQLRDAVVSLANTTYQGRYIYSGGADTTPAYSPNPIGYTNAGTSQSSQRYEFTTATGATAERNVLIADGISVAVNTTGSEVFDSSIQALEKLGRALEGYDSTTTGGVPDGGGVAWSFPTDTSLQTQAILDSITLLDTARTTDVAEEQVSVAGRLARLENQTSIMDTLKFNLNEVLSNTQGADIFESATNLSNAQNSLQVSMAVSGQILKINLLDYL
jgi:flagellar hook-associated protein 3 FlgL